MSNGFTMQESMTLLENRSNHPLFEQIRSRLEQGEEISAIFLDCCPKAYRRYFEGFILFLPFAQCLTLSMRTIKQERIQKQEYRKGLLYPCGMFLATLAGMILFNELCLPSLVSMMDGFRVSMGSFEHVHEFIEILSVSVIGFLLLSAILCLYFFREEHLVKGYQLAQKILPGSMFVQYASMDFIRFFNECIRLDIHTRESLQMIQKIEHKPLIRFLAGEIEQSLLAGEKFEAAVESPYLDPTLARFMKIAVYASDMEQMLDGYLAMCSQRIQRQCRRLTKTIQLISYSAIGLVLILVYQLLMLPFAGNRCDKILARQLG